jgi:molybdate transport system substrate-binding protein
MWWASIKNSFFLILYLMLTAACQKSAISSAKLYLASSLMPLAEDIQRFSLTQMPIELVFLSSGAIARQIEQGAPCDAAILADEGWQDYLFSKGLVRDRGVVVAKNSLVLASARAHPFLHDAVKLLRHLPKRHRLIIGDPDSAPLGSYTKEALLSLGLYENLREQFFYSHSARHAAILLTQGAAPFAILYRTDALNDKIAIIGRFNLKTHRPIEYPFLSCNNAKKEALAAIKAIIFSPAFIAALAAKGFGDNP